MAKTTGRPIAKNVAQWFMTGSDDEAVWKSRAQISKGDATGQQAVRQSSFHSFATPGCQLTKTVACPTFVAQMSLGPFVKMRSWSSTPRPDKLNKSLRQTIHIVSVKVPSGINVVENRLSTWKIMSSKGLLGGPPTDRPTYLWTY